MFCCCRDIAPSRQSEITKLCGGDSRLGLGLGGIPLKPSKPDLQAAASSTSLVRTPSSTSLASIQSASQHRHLPSGVVPEMQNPNQQGGLPKQLTEIEMLVKQVEEASAQGNGPIVKLRLKDLLERCSLAKATVTRQAAGKEAEEADAPAPEGDPINKTKTVIGGFTYRPETMLHFVLLSDGLMLGSR